MLHLITWLPHPYQLTLCRALFREYGSDFHAWFMESEHPDYPHASTDVSDFPNAFLDQCGYSRFIQALRGDPDPFVILGGWRSPMSTRIIATTSVLRVPLFIWADHPVPGSRGALKGWLRKRAIRMLARRASGMLACGNPTRDHLICLGVPAQKVVNFPYWTELPEAWTPPPRTVSDKGDRLRALAIGRHVRIKRFDTAIRAVAYASQELGVAIDLTLAGDGSLRPQLEAEARELGCEERIRFAGWLDSKQIAWEIQQADVLIVPSEFEPFGVVVLEGMAAGRPILASKGVIAALDRADASPAIQFHDVGDGRALAVQLAAFYHDDALLSKAAHASRAIAASWPTDRAARILRECMQEKSVA